jgi:hypothetical protein
MMHGNKITLLIHFLPDIYRKLNYKTIPRQQVTRRGKGRRRNLKLTKRTTSKDLYPRGGHDEICDTRLSIGNCQ